MKMLFRFCGLTGMFCPSYHLLKHKTLVFKVAFVLNILNLYSKSMAYEHQYFIRLYRPCASIYKVNNFRGMRFFWMVHVQLDVSMLNIFPFPPERENLRVFQQHKDIKGGSRNNALHPSLHLTIFVSLLL